MRLPDRLLGGPAGHLFQLFITGLPHFFQRLLAVGKDKIALLGVDAEGGLQPVALVQVEGTKAVKELAVRTSIVKEMFHIGCYPGKVSKNDQPGP